MTFSALMKAVEALTYRIIDLATDDGVREQYRDLEVGDFIQIVIDSECEVFENTYELGYYPVLESNVILSDSDTFTLQLNVSRSEIIRAYYSQLDIDDEVTTYDLMVYNHNGISSVTRH